jgi:hypothetical protein
MKNVVLLKSDLESDFAAAIYLSEAPPPVTHCICTTRTYILIPVIIHTDKKGGGQQGREYRAQSWVENTNMT